MIPNKESEFSTDWLNSEINRLFDEYSASKMALKPISAKIRGQKAEELIESYFAEHGKMPDSQYIDRLATYMLLDELTDNSASKSKNTEYAFLSDKQMYRRKVREVLLADVQSDNKDNVGKTTKTDYAIVISNLDTQQADLDTEMEFLRTCKEIQLEPLDILIVWETIFSNETVRSLERLTNLKKSAISTRLNRTLEKLRNSDLWQKLT